MGNSAPDSPDELDYILRALYIAQHGFAIREARAAIIKLIEGVIGEDEDVKRTPRSGVSITGQLQSARNALRAEQRQRLEGGTDGKISS